MAPVRIVLAMLASSLLASLAAPASACSCRGYLREEALRSFDVAFEGRVVAIRRLRGQRIQVSLRVTERWKGVDERQRIVRIVRSTAPALCPIPSFERGGIYAVYASRRDGVLMVGYCNPSRQISLRRAR